MIDPVFIGIHIQAKAEMSAKMLRKRDPDEKVGMFGRIDGKLTVIEYSDMSDADKRSRNPDGSLKYGAGSIAIHLINVDFVEKEAGGGLKLPYHRAFKKILFLDQEGRPVVPEQPNGYKFETFVFDALWDTTRSVVMEVIREEQFSPVKNSEGVSSPGTAQRDLSNLFGCWLEAAGMAIPRDEEGNVLGAIEIHPLFARNQKEFIKTMSQNIVFYEAEIINPEKSKSPLTEDARAEIDRVIGNLKENYGYSTLGALELTKYIIKERY